MSEPTDDLSKYGVGPPSDDEGVGDAQRTKNEWKELSRDPVTLRELMDLLWKIAFQRTRSATVADDTVSSLWIIFLKKFNDGEVGLIRNLKNWLKGAAWRLGQRLHHKSALENSLSKYDDDDRILALFSSGVELPPDAQACLEESKESLLRAFDSCLIQLESETGRPIPLQELFFELDKSGWKVAAAAKVLGIPARTLQVKMGPILEWLKSRTLLPIDSLRRKRRLSDIEQDARSCPVDQKPCPSQKCFEAVQKVQAEVAGGRVRTASQARKRVQKLRIQLPCQQFPQVDYHTVDPFSEKLIALEVIPNKLPKGPQSDCRWCLKLTASKQS